MADGRLFDSLTNKKGIIMNKNQILSTAIGSLLALGLTGGNAVAADKKMEMEKCYGVAKAGMNDCAGSKSAHACAGQAVKNNDPMDFVALPKGTCAKIAGGMLQEGMGGGTKMKGM
jgi:uncharacterized membrane protein